MERDGNRSLCGLPPSFDRKQGIEMLFHNRYERARKWQIEEKNKHDAMNQNDPRNDVEIADLLEKGDLYALISSAMFTIMPVAILVLLIMVLAGMLFMRIL